MFKKNLALNNLNGWYAIKPNQTKPSVISLSKSVVSTKQV